MFQLFTKEQHDSLLDRVTKLVAWFVGSWWGVFFHTAWFASWFVFNKSIDDLTLWVSLEAIFIGIFLLMASNRAEEARDRKEAAQQRRQMKQINTDVSLDESQATDIKHIKSELKKIQAQLETLTASGSNLNAKRKKD